MLSNIPLLQNVRIAAPCHESWADMTSVDGDRVRHCSGCQLNVYNLSAMTQAEAEGLLRRHEGRLCVRYYQRHDGTVLTRNCPVGAHAARLLLIRQSLVAAVLLVAAAGAVPPGGTVMGRRSAAPLMDVPTVSAPTMGSPATTETVGKAMVIPPPQVIEPATPEMLRPTMGEVRSRPVEQLGEASAPEIERGFQTTAGFATPDVESDHANAKEDQTS